MGKIINKSLIKNRINEEIDRQIEIEFLYGLGFNINKKFLYSENKEALLEEYGMIPDLDNYINIFFQYIEKKIDSGKRSFFILDNIFENIPSCFFQNVMIQVEKDKTKENDGIYRMQDNNFDNENKKIITLFIRLYYNSNRRFDILQSLKVSFAHEITHAYEDYKRQCNEAVRLKDLKKNSTYISLNVNSKNVFRNFIHEILYCSIDFETRAFVGEFASELKTAFDLKDYETSDELKALVKTMPSYSRHNKAKEALYKIEDILINDKDDKFRTFFVNEYNKFSQKHYADYQSAFKDFEINFLNAWNKFLTNTSKIAFKIFDNYNAYLT